VAYFGPMGDLQATRAAATFYSALAAGKKACEAVRRARRVSSAPHREGGRSTHVYPLGWAQLALYHQGKDEATTLPATAGGAPVDLEGARRRIFKRLDREGGSARVEGISGVQRLRFGFVGRRKERAEALRRWRDGSGGWSSSASAGWARRPCAPSLCRCSPASWVPGALPCSPSTGGTPARSRAGDVPFSVAFHYSQHSLRPIGLDPHRHQQYVVAKDRAVDHQHREVPAFQRLGEPPCDLLASPRDEAPGHTRPADRARAPSLGQPLQAAGILARRDSHHHLLESPLVERIFLSHRDPTRQGQLLACDTADPRPAQLHLPATEHHAALLPPVTVSRALRPLPAAGRTAQRLAVLLQHRLEHREPGGHHQLSQRLSSSHQHAPPPRLADRLPLPPVAQLLPLALSSWHPSS
jgi:hypothetical protein